MRRPGTYARFTSRYPCHSASIHPPEAYDGIAVTEAGGRAELALGTATVRLDERTELSISTLDATTVRVELNHGTVSVHQPSRR